MSLAKGAGPLDQTKRKDKAMTKTQKAKQAVKRLCNYWRVRGIKNIFSPGELLEFEMYFQTRRARKAMREPGFSI